MEFTSALIKESNPRACIASKVMKTHRIVNTIFRKRLLPFGITNSQLSVLFILSKKELVSQKELSDMLYLEKSTINRNLKKLVKANWVEKIQVRHFGLTNEGIFLLEAVIPEWDKAMQETKQILGKEGEKALDRILHQLTQKS